MAINPNTDFTAGAILTASQQNRFPRGIVALATSSSTYAVTTTEAIATGMTVTFTAVANRYYKLTYFESYISAAAQECNQRIRLTNAAGSEQAFTGIQTASGGVFSISSVVKTFSAGSVTLVGTLKNISSGGSAVRGGSALAYLMVEDLGPA